MDEGAGRGIRRGASGGKDLPAPGHEMNEVDEEISSESGSEEAVLAARPAVPLHLARGGPGAPSAHGAVMTRGSPPITVPGRRSYRTRSDEAIVVVSIPISRRN